MVDGSEISADGGCNEDAMSIHKTIRQNFCAFTAHSTHDALNHSGTVQVLKLS